MPGLGPVAMRVPLFGGAPFGPLCCCIPSGIAPGGCAPGTVKTCGAGVAFSLGAGEPGAVKTRSSPATGGVAGLTVCGTTGVGGGAGGVSS